MRGRLRGQGPTPSSLNQPRYTRYPSTLSPKWEPNESAFRSSLELSLNNTGRLLEVMRSVIRLSWSATSPMRCVEICRPGKLCLCLSLGQCRSWWAPRTTGSDWASSDAIEGTVDALVLVVLALSTSSAPLRIIWMLCSKCRCAVGLLHQGDRVAGVQDF